MVGQKAPSSPPPSDFERSRLPLGDLECEYTGARGGGQHPAVAKRPVQIIWGSEVNMDVPEISAESLHNIIKTGVAVVDVREPDEWQEAHLAESKLIPLGEVVERSGEFPMTDRYTCYAEVEFVVQCL